MIELLNTDPLLALAYIIITLSTIVITVTSLVVIRQERAKLKK
jgi:hypothetical protein